MIRLNEERRRLSATMVNTIASGVITAGTAGSLIAFSLAAQPGVLAVRVLIIWICAVIAGTSLHLLAHAILGGAAERVFRTAWPDERDRSKD